MDHIRARSTVDHGGAARSAAAHPPELGLRPLRLTGDSWGGVVGHGGLAPGLTRAREAVEWQCHDGGGALGAGLLGVRR
jgi:hypothetical protein